jgi:hypothetical protein
MYNIIKMSGFLLLGISMTMTSCKKKGCDDPTATNYSPEAKKNDGSCVYSTTTPEGNNPSIPSAVKVLFLSNRNNDKQSFTVNSDIKSQLIGTKGTKITIPKGAFVNENGIAITGNITLEILEVMDQSSMIWYGLPTMSNGRMLESGGELMVKAYANGQELGLANGKSLAIKMPSDNNKAEMTLYYGVETKAEIGDVNWLLGDSLGFDDSITYDNIDYCDTLYYTYQDSNYLSAPLASNWQSNYPNLDSNSVWYSIDQNNDTLGVFFNYGEETTYMSLDCSNLIQNPDLGYQFNMDQLGWINCDFLWSIPGTRSTLNVLPSSSDFTGANTEIYIHFTNVNAITELQFTGGSNFNSYDQLPTGVQFTIVAISELNGTYYSSFTPVTMSNNLTETITMTATTIADIQNTINNL